MPKRHFRSEFYAICLECQNKIALNLETMKQRDKDDSIVPFSAKSSNSTVACNECYSIKHRIIFEYHYIYRIRCNKCGTMFDSKFANSQSCYKCFLSS